MRFSIHEDEAKMQVVFVGLDECQRCGATLCDEMCVPCAKRKIRAMEAAQQSVQSDGAYCEHNQPALVNPETNTCVMCGLSPRR